MKNRIKYIVEKLGYHNEDQDFITDIIYSLNQVSEVTIKEQEDSFIITNLDEQDIELLEKLKLLGKSKLTKVIEIDTCTIEMLKIIRIKFPNLTVKEIIEKINALGDKGILVLHEKSIDHLRVVSDYKLSIYKNGESSIKMYIAESIYETIIKIKNCSL